MKFRNQYLQYLAPATDGTEGSGGGSTTTSGTTQADIAAAIEQATAGLKTKNLELLAEKKKLSEFVSKFDGLDPATLVSYIDRLKNDEEAKLIAEGKIGDVIDRRTERMRTAFEQRVAESNQKAQELEQNYRSLESNYHQMQIDAAVRDAAIAAKVTPSAIDDILYRARQVFSVTDGKILSKDQSTNEVRIGPDGKKPYSPSDFLTDLAKQAPHFWPQSTSGGFTGQGGTAKDFDTAAKQALASANGMAEYRRLRAKQKAE